MFTTGEALIGQIQALPGVETVNAPVDTPPKRYNIAPTNQVAVVRFEHNEATIGAGRWGLIPHWKKDDSGPPLFNARAETIQQKPSFRRAFAHNRAVMPLDGYYEWHVDEKGKKTPYHVSIPGSMLWAAALWDEGTDVLSATMVTTDSAEPISWLHHRLPRFLTTEEIKQWTLGSPEEAASLLHPAPSQLREALVWQEADQAVGNVCNDYPELIDATHSRLL